MAKTYKANLIIRFAGSIFLISLYFVLSAVLIFFDLDFRTFNLIEGINWFVLGFFALSLLSVAPERYRKLALFSFIILIIFGVTDFIEIKTGAYWIPWWLFALNILCVAGMIFSLLWFVKLRYKH